MALCAEDIQTSRIADFFRFGSDLLLIFIVKLGIELSCAENCFVVGLRKACRFKDKILFDALSAHFGFREVFGVTAEHNIRTASRHVRRDSYRALFTCLRNDLRFALVVLRVEDFMLYTCLFEHF